jgi:hypothetical protein
MAKRTKPALTLAEHTVLGADLYAMHERLLAIAVDVGARYPARVRAQTNRTATAISALAQTLDALLWTEQRGLVDRATLGAVYFPDVPGSAADAAAPAAKPA